MQEKECEKKDTQNFKLQIQLTAFEEKMAYLEVPAKEQVEINEKLRDELSSTKEEVLSMSNKFKELEERYSKLEKICEGLIKCVELERLKNSHST